VICLSEDRLATLTWSSRATESLCPRACARSRWTYHRARSFSHGRRDDRDSRRIDIATARQETYAQPATLPIVEQSSIEEDLHRRDFTINTLAICLNPRRFGILIDNGGGRRDLKDGTIRVLHKRSFMDDPTRLFRAVRFEQRFGFHMDAETLALAKGAMQTNLIHRLSGSRLRRSGPASVRTRAS